MPGLTPSPCGADAHSGIGASWPGLESGEPIFDEDALAMLRLEDGTRISLSSGYSPGDDLLYMLLLLYGASEYIAPLSYATEVVYS